ncbi:hypothetical protein D9619_008567 [Psilocybe cf. subviscida]|uniref:DUF6534 domain-containing protein n=1 Tax=Psilocybe cf. subviscida TaxID=2480587 RepID=A0A8H5BAC8_9AGAR|nr:hypothetical protein D9619_008567 [Psilocybe cf. subviscida]
MSTDLNRTIGVWLLSMWFQSLFQGCGLLQGWLYFHWYKNDSWGIRAMVSAILAIETAQIIIFFQMTYVYLIDGFGDLNGLTYIHWEGMAQLGATYISAFIVQMYFAYCVYVLNRDDKFSAGLIVVLALLQISSGIAEITSISIHLGTFEALSKPNIITAHTIQSAAACLCDFAITASLVLKLGRHKGNMKSTDTLLHTLTINIINRGMLTAVCALVNLILFVARPGTLYFFIGLESSGKLYMNSALATLNSRQHITKKAYENRKTDWNSLAMSNMGSPSVANEDHRVRVVVTQESHSDLDMPGDKKPSFMDGMI